MDVSGNFHKFSYVALALLQSLITCNPAQADEEPDGSHLRLITATCYTCHSDNSDKAAIPSLDSRPTGEIKQLLTDYKTDQKQATVMSRIARALTDDEIDRISAMFNKTSHE